jgi:radical SAM protein with 4Fe4S-binding SPASM domain
MSLTVAELPAMRSIASSLGVNFRFDPILNNDVDRKQGPLPLRLSAEEVAALDLADPQRHQDWRDFVARQNALTPDEKHVYRCGAGYSGFHIDPTGKLSVCMAARSQAYDLRQGTFKEGWEVFLRKVRYTPLLEKGPCTACKVRPLCGMCPGWNDSENVSPDQPVEYICKIGHKRAQVLGLVV